MIGALALALALQDPIAAAGQPDAFSHPQHRRLFTSCTGCHAGIVSGERTHRMPEPGDCRTCHDGAVRRVVFWRPAEAPRPTHLRFDHRRHAAEAPEVACAGCHALADTTGGFMAVGRARPETCTSCHEHGPSGHLARGSCTPCHGALTQETDLSVERIARFPQPPSHDARYALTHGAEARTSGTCEVCHSRESCAACHPNARQLAPISALGSDSRVAELVLGRTPAYPQPATHGAPDFLRAHGMQARHAVATCANCHTRESCLTCHRADDRTAVVAQLARRTRDGAPGVALTARRPPDHVPGFRAEHRVAAAGGDQSCSRCHTPRFCASCHDGAASPTFHPANFVARHSRASYIREGDCASCHQTQAFCVSCHRQSGLQQRQAPTANRFHTNTTFWLLGHGAAARRSLESCTTCHQQRFCLQCHSAATGWKVSPHGDDFDPRLGDRNPAMCRACHPAGPRRR